MSRDEHNTGFGVEQGGDTAFLRPGGRFDDLRDVCALRDDFLGNSLDGTYSGASGSDAEASDPAIQSALNGHVRMSTGDSNTSVAADSSSLTHALNWQADQGSVLFEARVQIDDNTNCQINVGFTDVLASGTLELPFSLDSSDNLTSNASDAVCFVYDTTGTSNWFAAGVAGDTDAGPTDLGTSPSNGTFQRLRIEVDSSGNADFYIDGTHQANLSSAVSSDTALTPILIANSLTTAQRNLDADYLWVQQDR